MQSKASTVKDYFASLPEDRRRTVEAIRAVILKNLGKACVRFKSLDDVPLEVVGRTIRKASVKKFIEKYEAANAGSRATAASASSRKAGGRKVASKSGARVQAAPARRSSR